MLLETDLKVHMVLLELSLFQTPQNLFRGILPAVTGDAQENVEGPPVAHRHHVGCVLTHLVHQWEPTQSLDHLGQYVLLSEEPEV